MIQHIHFKSIASTQDEAKKVLSSLQPGHWRLHTTSEQTNGRATHGRIWHSSKNTDICATYSFLLATEKKSVLFNIPQVAALCIAEVLEKHGLTPSLKWVNDILLGKRKVAGILCESEPVVHDNHSYLGVLLGIGINVNTPKEALADIDQPATSMKRFAGRAFDITEIIEQLTETLEVKITQLLKEGFSPFQQALEEHLEYFDNTPIVFDTQSTDGYLVGIIQGVGVQGELLIQEPSGVQHQCYFGRILPKTKNQ